MEKLAPYGTASMSQVNTFWADWDDRFQDHPGAKASFHALAIGGGIF